VRVPPRDPIGLGDRLDVGDEASLRTARVGNDDLGVEALTDPGSATGRPERRPVRPLGIRAGAGKLQPIIMVRADLDVDDVVRDR